MRRLLTSRLLNATLCVSLVAASLPAPAPAGGADRLADSASSDPAMVVAPTATEPPSTPTTPAVVAQNMATLPDSVRDLPEAFDRARQLLRDAQYDEAIAALRSALERAHGHPVLLREAYLLLINAYVVLGNDLRFRRQGVEASNLNYLEARKLVEECLMIRALRHTRPEPASDYPPGMIDAFSEVRGRIFGSFRVTTLEPREAIVLLDSDTLRALPNGGGVGDDDIAVGSHRVVVRAHGHRDRGEDITIAPGSTLTRSYQLPRRRGVVFYAVSSALSAVLVSGIYAIGRRSGSGSPTPEPLPAAPDPPRR